MTLSPTTDVIGGKISAGWGLILCDHYWKAMSGVVSVAGISLFQHHNKCLE